MKYHPYQFAGWPVLSSAPSRFPNLRVLLLSLVLCRAISVQGTVFDFVSPLTGVSATPSGSGVSLLIFDPAVGSTVGTTVPSGPTSDLLTIDGVAAWSSGTTVYYYTYDPGRTNWVGSSTNAGLAHDLRTTNGIVSWSTGTSSTVAHLRVYDRQRGSWRNDFYNSGATVNNLRTVDGVTAWTTTSSAHGRAYDLRLGRWLGFNITGVTPSDLINTNGVIAWSSGSVVYAYTYDPIRGAWRGTNYNLVSGSTFDLRNANGIVAWSRSPSMFSEVYDPRSGQWVAQSVNIGGQTFNLSVSNNTVTCTGPTVGFTRGYHPASGWYQGPGLPLAYFAVSTNFANGPLVVYFMDMSLGGMSWNWNFGDGIGASSARSPSYRYSTLGQFVASESVSGNLLIASTNLAIVTDIAPPTGSILINNGATLTTTNFVTLGISATDNSGLVALMRFSNDNTNNWTAWEPYATSKSWMLSAGSGTKVVFVQFRDAVTNTSAPFSDSIQLDSTPIPTVSFIVSNVVESAALANVIVSLDHSLNRQVSVSYFTADGTATAGLDYTAVTGRVDFASGETSRAVPVPILQDSLVELNETVRLNFTNPTNCIPGPQGTLTILDDDLASVSFASTNFTVSENGGSAAIGIQLNAASGQTVSVRCIATNGTALAGSDFTATNGLVTIMPGQTNAIFLVPIINDTLDELSETVSLRLTNATNVVLGTPTNAILTILDDDAPTVSFSRASYPVFESEGVAVIEVVLSKLFSQAVSVDYTAFGGSATPGVTGDYLPANGTLNFSANVTNKIFFVNLVNDAAAEPDKTIHLTLNNITGARAGAYLEADILLYDDDGAPRLLSPRLTTNLLFQTTLHGKTGQVFSIEFSTNAGDWFPLSKLTNTSASGLFDFTDPQSSTNILRRFYRSVLP